MPHSIGGSLCLFQGKWEIWRPVPKKQIDTPPGDRMNDYTFYEIKDFEAYQFNDGNDYPDCVVSGALAVANGEINRGIAICGAYRKWPIWTRIIGDYSEVKELWAKIIF
jgi:hypothetical protein